MEYAQLELTVTKEMLGTKRLRFTDDQRRRLAAKAKKPAAKVSWKPNGLPEFEHARV